MKNGLIKGYYPDGTLKWEANYVNGKKNGEYREYCDDGDIAFLENYKNDKQHGLKQVFNCGEVEREVNYVNGKKNGEEIEYNLKLCQIQSLIHWKDGKKDGVEQIYNINKYFEFYDNGQDQEVEFLYLKYEKIWENDKLIEIKEYDKDKSYT
ncbi:hypothetical protein A9K75_08620 [Campylobacter fetus subsp. testudinum]|uniref:toxin-antitoxin system YwqK family antitoxin n=1 Tax=Campylobacter fetus TaxID=196 RepID=UPI000818B4AD|nr:hypothetical protein [Campylobacter fetus]OCR99065.1 hypothetical protein A9K75_08620 [Campylobacter fetus subsp. testudinum]